MKHSLRALVALALALAVCLGLAIGSASAGASISRPSSAAPNAAPVHLPLISNQVPLRLAVIGDYGVPSPEAQAVSELVAGWRPDAVLTTGDNNYPSGEAATIDRNIGAYYHQFIAPYRGQYGAGGATNRFFPTLGNHDWVSGAQPYLDYFALPGNERYYTVTLGAVQIFALDSDPHEPDGVTADSAQAAWLRQALAESTACWKLVTLHHPPFSSGPHGSNAWMQWPFAAWGADAVLAGHDHTYERVMVGATPYIVNGLGGNVAYQFGAPVAGSAVRFTGEVGAMLIEVGGNDLVLRFVTRAGQEIDRYALHKEC